ncbi:hypothetical protein MKW98_011381 [Papaver atlanticum]|uniref:Uncharacterized protein n=1 Tax=Papaver atlanticum TaxID=357466 RepID=A0AAD4SW92_9MAGN|nr:hypothetical protein MKW98_011381 [Papaver atlanticum]
MDVADSSPEQFWRSLWSKLSQHRLELKHLFNDWDITPFQEKLQVFEPYLDLLFRNGLRTSGHHIHKDRSDVNADLEILQRLHNQLERDIAEGKRYRIKHQIAGEGTIFPDADFRDWMVEKLRNEDWEDYLEFVNANEADVLYRAAAQGVELEKQTITSESIRVRDTDEVKSRLTVMNLWLGRAPYWCKLIDKVICELSRRHLVEPVEESR